MAEGTLRGPQALAPAARQWRRISPRLVPVFAVLTALIISMLFMMLSTFIRVGSVDIGAELNKTGTAYSALIEGSIGVVINNTLTADGLTLARTYASSGEISPRQANQAARLVSTSRAMRSNVTFTSRVSRSVSFFDAPGRSRTLLTPAFAIFFRQ